MEFVSHYVESAIHSYGEFLIYSSRVRGVYHKEVAQCMSRVQHLIAHTTREFVVLEALMQFVL